jgi:hypothetical protein
MNPASTMAIQPELLPGETIYWSGQPNPRVIFHKEDVFLIPFSLLFGGFAIFWEAIATGLWDSGTHHAPLFFMLWGVPFVVLGQYFIWGRFTYDAWLKRRTHYAVTNRRVIVLQDGRSRKLVSAYLDSLPAIAKQGPDSGPGTLQFAPAASFWANVSGTSSWSPSVRSRNHFAAWNTMSLGDSPIFRDIDDLDSVYRLVSDLREKSRHPSSA